MEFAVLGPLLVADHPSRGLDLGPYQRRLALAALLCRANAVVGDDTLAEALWGFDAPPSAAGTIRVHVHKLRRVLGAQRIVRAAAGYRLIVHPDELDSDRFRALRDRARRAAADGRCTDAVDLFRRAMGLWRGPAFAEFPDAEIIRLAASSLDESRLDVLEECAELELDLGRHTEVGAELRAPAAAHPLRENLQAQLMLALVHSGRQAEATAVFHRTRRILADEYGLAPGPRLLALHQQILANDSRLRTGRPATPRHLPALVTGFAGRQEHLGRLDALLAAPAPGTSGAETPTAVVITAVSGTAGVGKTALAVHWAHSVAHRFPDGQLYVNLRGFDLGGQILQPGEAVRSFLDALGVPPERIPAELDAQAALYRSLIADRHLLILLDNARDVGQVQPLLPATGTSLAMVTSRNALTGLVAAHGAHPVMLDVLSDDEAREVLVRRLGADRVNAEPAAAQRIVTACAGLPLALAIAAARARQTSFPLAALADELHDAGQRLDALDAGDPSHQIRAVFSWSYRTLTADAARLFRLLGLHPGPDTDAAAAANLTGEPLTATRRLLHELTRANLLSEHSPGRYTFHDLLRAYAAEQAHAQDTDGQRHTAVIRLLDHYLHTAHAGDRLLSPARDPIRLAPARADVVAHRLTDHRHALQWFTAERRVLLAAVEHAASTGSDVHAWQLGWTLDTFLYRTGHWHDWLTAATTAVGAADRLGEPRGRLCAHRLLADAYIQSRDYDGARAQLRQALAAGIAAGDRTGQGSVHMCLVWLWDCEEDSRRALDHAYQAQRLFRADGNRHGEARALSALGWHHAQCGDHRQALATSQEALAVLRQLGDRALLAATWDTIGYVRHHLGHHAEAVTCYQQALELYRDLEARYSQAEVLHHLGDTHHATGDDDAARDVWQQALSFLDDLHHPEAEAVRGKVTRLPPPPGGVSGR